MPQAKFVEGSILKHILVMSSTSAIGISAIFVVDLVDIFFLSLLGEHEVTAAVGYAGTIAFFTTSIGIGLSIAMGALVSRAIGARETERAKRLLMSTAVTTLIISILVLAVVLMLIPDLLNLLGAHGRTAELASSYLYILVPSLPFICLTMSLGAALRAVGDAKLAMNTTLLGGVVNAIFDPIFIFALSMGIEGAAIASVIARFAALSLAIWAIAVKHRLIGRFQWTYFVEDLRPIFNVAGPAMLTNIATPIGNGFITRAIADFGDTYVASWAVIGRIIPVCFGMIFALSGAVGPIIGQNFGAMQFDRVRLCLTRALQFSVVYVVFVSLLLMLLSSHVSHWFGLSAEGTHMFTFFSHYIAITFVFSGALFIANASFNNLGKAKYSTFFNVGRATVGTIPFIYVGAKIGGVYGVLVGQALGMVIFSIVAVWWAYRLVDKVSKRYHCSKL